MAAGGGGAFLICYALIVLFVGFPVMLAELSIGRSTQKNVVGAFRRLNPRWSFAGGIGVLTLFVIMSYYSVVGGWVMKYIAVYLTGADFSAFGNDSSRFSAYFADFISRPAEPLLWGAVFLLLCIYVVVRGVSEGIERVSKFLMPGLFVLLTGIVVYAITLDGAAEGLKYMLAVDPAKFNGGTVVAALGQAFFSLSVGMGIMVTYAQCAIDCEGSKVVAYRIPSHSGALTGNNDFFQNFYLRIKIYCLNIHLFECLTQIYILRFVAQTLYKNCILGICLPRDNDSSSG